MQSATLWQTPIPTTYTLLPSTLTALRPSSTPTISSLPTIPTTPITPYSTAQAISTNAVAFVAEDPTRMTLTSALWIANVDGSGERELVDYLDTRPYDTLLKWSPNRKWISYISGSDLWIVSPDGSMKRKILSPIYGEIIYTYQWSPDGSQIAYTEGVLEDSPTITIGLIDIITGESYELSPYEAPPSPIVLAWSPNGHYLLILPRSGFSILDVNIRKVVKVIDGAVNCFGYYEVTWSPNNQWFYYLSVGNGRFATKQICVAGLDGSNREIDSGGTVTSDPLWDKTGNFLYFVAANTNFSITPIPDYDLRLMRYDVRTQKQERVLKLGTEPNNWYISMSPDGQIIEAHPDIRVGNQQSFVILDLNSISTMKHTANFGIINKEAFSDDIEWSSDSQNIVIFSEEYIPKNYGFLDYGPFYTLDIRTGQTDIISGDHRVTDWIVSPAVTNP